MEILKWLLPTGLAILSGILLVNYLTVHPLRMHWYLFGFTVTLSALVVALITGFTSQTLWIAILLALLAMLAGYAGMASITLSRDDTRPIPELVRSRGDPGLGHTAVVYFTHGEPETYDPIGWINQFKEFDEQGIPFVPFLARPLFIYQLRKKYLQVGKSEHRGMHKRMLRSLEQSYRAAGDETTRFYLSFLDDDPRPDAAVIQALNDGASRIIVSEVFMTISNHTAEGKELIENLNLQEYGVPVYYTGPLYNSRTLQQMFVARANAHLAEADKSRVGVLLVGHGQPDEWDIEWPTETEQEISFRQEVLHLLEQDGYQRENLSLAWMEFKEPKPAPKVSEYARNGVEKVLYFSTGISADAIHSQHDVPALVNQADVPAGLPLVNLGAWNDDPLVIRAIKEKIDLQLTKITTEG